MLISIVITTFNRKEKVAFSIQSALDQTYSNIEVVVVDDGSSDGTVQFLKERFQDSRVRILRIENNQGASFARNHGISESRGEYVMVWDSDDVLFAYCINSCVESIVKTRAEIISAPAVPIADGKEISYQKRPEGYVATERIVCKYLPNNEKIRLVKRELFQEVKYQSRNLDFMVNSYLSRKGRWYHLSEPLGEVNVFGRDSLTAKRKKKNIALSAERAPFLDQYLREFKGPLLECCPTRYADYSYGASIGYIVSANVKKARYWSKEACLKGGPSLRRWGSWILARMPGGGRLLRGLFSLSYS